MKKTPEMKNINISLYRVQIHLLKNRKSGFQDPSKYAPRAPQDRPRRHLDPQGPSRSSQGLSGTSLGPSQDASGGPSRPPRTPQKALGPFQDLPRTPKYPPRDPSGAPKASQGPPWDPPRCLRTPLQGLPGPLRTPWDLPRTSSIPFRSSQNPAAAPKTCFRTAQGLQNKARICS